jgi:hypothetical protein
MKNFTYLALFIFTIASVQPIQTQDQTPSTSNQTIFTSMYSYIWQPKKIDMIPVAKKEMAIIFDLDGVIFTTNTWQAFQEIGIDTTLQYIQAELFYNYQLKFPSKAALFKALELTPAVSTFDAYHEGIRMPQIMVDQQIASQSLMAIQLAMNHQINSSTRLDAEKR